MSEATPTEHAPAKEAKAGKSSPLLLVVTVLCLVNAAGTGYVAMIKSHQPVVMAAPPVAEKEHQDNLGPTAPLDAFVVNLNEPGGSPRYLKIALELELSSNEATADVTRAKPALRDEFLR